MAASKTDFPAVRACIFDMDGLLINTEDILTLCINQLLHEYGRPPCTPSFRAQLWGVPDSTKSDMFLNWAKLPIAGEQWARELSDEQVNLRLPDCKPLPGSEQLLSNLSRARSANSGIRIKLALASTSETKAYKLKTSQPEIRNLFDFIQPPHRILGDDPRVRQGRNKPAGDIYLVALDSLNATLDPDEGIIKPSECLVFEDSVAGVEAGRRAGMRAVWVPHEVVAAEYHVKQKHVLAGRSGIFEVGDDWQLGEIDDGWGESIPSLQNFDYKKYGIDVPP